MFTVSAWDTPGKDFDAQHPPGYDPIATSQGYVFTTYLACYSTDFSHTYVAAGKFDWSLDFLFNYSSLEWTYSSSTITAPSGTTNSGMPQNAHSSGAVTVAPALGRVQNHVYA